MFNWSFDFLVPLEQRVKNYYLCLPLLVEVVPRDSWIRGGCRQKLGRHHNGGAIWVHVAAGISGRKGQRCWFLESQGSVFVLQANRGLLEGALLNFLPEFARV